MKSKITIMAAGMLLLVSVAVSAQEGRGGMRHGNHQRIWQDTSRLSALLSDVQSNAAVPGESWRRVANEAGVLADRIYSRSGPDRESRNLARNLRMQVREMRKSALSGDAAGARMHAHEALPYANQLADWASPDEYRH